MATNIGSSATMTLTSMKPDAGEQLDALWGKNIADNTGYLRGRPIGWISPDPRDDFSSSATQYGGTLIDFTIPTIYFYRTPGHNRFAGTFIASGTFTADDAPDMAYSFGPYLVGDLAGSSYAYALTATVSNIGSTHTAGSTWNFDIDISSYVSEGSWGTFELFTYGRLTDFSSGTNSITWNITYPMVARTYWG